MDGRTLNHQWKRGLVLSRSIIQGHEQEQIIAGENV